MNRIYCLIILFLACALSSNAQYIRYTVQLKDKKGSAFSLSQPTAFLSAKSIQRRARQNIPLDSTDLPVSKIYLDSLSRISGVTIINTSRWLNNVLVEAPDSAAVVKINSFPFVFNLTPVSLHPGMPHGPPIFKNIGGEKPAIALTATNSFRVYASDAVLEDTINYGTNYPQVHIHEGEYLHKRGFRGQDITIAILDAGFRSYQSNPAFDSLRAGNQILGEYDFVNNEFEVNTDDAHGANCLSIMASNIPGHIVGTAPKANYYLFKSEDVYSEKPIEEQYWAVAAERADSAGADMISSSLGYSNFDDTLLSLTYSKRDGKTSPITIAANMAFKKGMIVTCSSGNSGEIPTDYKYVMCPADGDDVLAIGSVDVSGIISPFSSGGPNGAGKLKPNVVSVGSNTVFANIHGTVSTGSGTSYSNPNLAGLIACLWQAFTDMSNADIIDAVQRSADKFGNPNQRYGYGIPNMRIAYQLLEAKRKQRASLDIKNTFITAYPVPFRQSFTLYVKAPATGNAMIRILDINGKLVQVRSVQLHLGSYYNIHMNPAISSSGIYYLQYDDGKNRAILKLVRL
jgi:serine protease AprX